MRKISMIKVIILLLILFSFIACEYNPTGTNYVEVTPIISNPVITLPEEGTVLEIRGDIDIDYDIDTDGATLEYIRFSVDNTIIATKHDSQGTFTIESSDFPDGTYTLKAESLLYSNSGSLASNLHLEGYIREQSWTLITYNAYLQGVDITQACEYEGRVKISWEPYEGRFFEKYQLRLFGANARDIEIFEQETSSYVDSIFANGEFWGYLEVYAHGDDEQGDGFSIYDYQPENITSIPNAENYPQLEWDECIYYVNCSGYKVYNSTYEVATIPSYDITSWTDDQNLLVFGEIRNYHVKAMNSDNQVYYEFNELNETEAYLGSIFTNWYGNIVFNPNGYVYVVNDSIRVFDANSMNLMNTRYHQTNSSLGIRYVESSNELFWANGNYIREIDPVTLFSMENTHIDDLLPGVNNPNLYEFQVTENRFLLVASSESTLSGYVIDRNNGNYFNVPEIGLTFHLLISSDGNYCVNSHHLFQIDNNSASIICDLDSDDTHLFRNNEEFVTISGSDILVRRMDNLQTVSNFQTEFELEWINIASDTGYLYGNLDGVFQVYNLDTGSLISEMEVYQNGRYDLYNDVMYCGNGVFLGN